MTDPDLTSLELRIGRLLRIGVAASSALFAFGLAAWWSRLGAADRILEAGVILLLALPILRIVTACVDAVRRRDRLLGWATALVLAVLAMSIVYSLMAS